MIRLKSNPLLRRMAMHLGRHAARLMPEARRDWAAAMLCEIDHIERDGAALCFVFGFFLVAVREWLLSGHGERAGRFGLAFAFLAWAGVCGALALWMLTGLLPMGAPFTGPAVMGVIQAVLAGLYVVASFSLFHARFPVLTGLMVGILLLNGAQVALHALHDYLWAEEYSFFMLAILLEHYVVWSAFALTAAGSWFWRRHGHASEGRAS